MLDSSGWQRTAQLIQCWPLLWQRRRNWLPHGLDCLQTKPGIVINIEKRLAQIYWNFKQVENIPFCLKSVTCNLVSVALWEEIWAAFLVLGSGYMNTRIGSASSRKWKHVKRSWHFYQWIGLSFISLQLPWTANLHNFHLTQNTILY